jgi:hypothetical protein
VAQTAPKNKNRISPVLTAKTDRVRAKLNVRRLRKTKVQRTRKFAPKRFGTPNVKLQRAMHAINVLNNNMKKAQAENEESINESTPFGLATPMRNTLTARA